ncbi:MAG: amidohydrolase family protein [Acidobacteria bacterium]|nr:amidohydrolase family protein [Acidobacteriota bacterium]
MESLHGRHREGASGATALTRLITSALLLLSALASAQQKSGLPSATREFIRVDEPVVALTHLEVIDGTGGPVKRDQTILIDNGRIVAMGNSQSLPIPPEARLMDFRGYSALPGLVGMHDHLFYSVNYFRGDGVLAYDMPFSFPRLFLAAGVTTIRTTGAFEPYTDLEIKKAVESGALIGPKMNVTGPYLVDSSFPLIQLHKLTGPDDARRLVNYWADEGVTSFKAYTDITRDELHAAVEAAHARGLTITGHFCSIGFREAAEIGVDGIEHGLFVDTEFIATKKPDVCPEQFNASAADMDVDGEQIQAMIKILVEHHVAITSTLPVWEEFIPPRKRAPERVLAVLSPAARQAYFAKVNRMIRESQKDSSATAHRIRRYRMMTRKEMEFELAFVHAGGLLLAGSDAVLGANVAGFGDQRELELLVEAGLSPVEAIRIATLNGAKFLKVDNRIGSLEPNKQADIVLVKGDLANDIDNIEKGEIVFKGGVGYDSRQLIGSVAGQVGIR